MQLWVKNRHAKAVKSTETVNPRLLVAKRAMRASPQDGRAQVLHVFVLHSPCEVAAPHDSNAFDMQVHQRLNGEPRGQMCLLLGDFNARVGSTADDCFGNQSLKTEMEKRCVNWELRTTWSHSTLATQGTLHLDESCWKTCPAGLHMSQHWSPHCHQVGGNAKGH